MKINTILKDAITRLEKAGVENPRLDALMIIEYATKQPREHIIAAKNETLTDEAKNEVHSLLTRRESRVPMAYLLGTRDFYGLEFQVDDKVLVPRPETEVMVEYAIENCSESAKVIELGTGSGCIAIALSKNRPDLSILATDNVAGTLEMAALNNKKLKTHVKFHWSDIFAGIDKSGMGGYDVVLANLPYVPVHARRQPEIEFEPDESLYGGEDGLDFYRTFFIQLPKHLKKDGFAVIEASPTQRAALAELAKEQGYELTPISEYIFRIN